MSLKEKLVKKLKDGPNAKLSKQDYLEMSEYDHDELVKMFTNAIHDLAKKGLLSPEETKRYLKNINKWLLELLKG